jgi:60 kDa SS-A/Ro ribonucleoprotein
MSRFNKQTQSNKTINLAGGDAFVADAKLRLVTLLLTSFVKDQFYRSANTTVDELGKLIAAIPDKRFVAQAAIFARTEYGMRSISHVAAGEIARRVKGVVWTKRFFDRIVHRPDDMTEILAYLYATGLTTEPNALKKGFAQAFGRFDAYQLAKYRKEGSEVSLVDVANLVHPVHTEAVARLINGTLPTPETWETELSAAGADEEAKQTAWVDLVRSRKLGYFALLRNLRNILLHAPEVVDEACAMLTDEKRIRSSLVLPFRYTTAIEEIRKLNADGTREVLDALNRAVDIALSNVPRFTGKTLVALDVSGSMGGKPIAIGALFATVLVKTNNADLMLFDHVARYETLNPRDSTLTIVDQIKTRATGGGTDFHTIFDTANRAYDRIIILSDMQAWIGQHTPTKTFEQYKRKRKANPHIYSFDLQGYGTLQFPQPEVSCLAGFSEKTLDVLQVLERDKQALIHQIEAVEL